MRLLIVSNLYPPQELGGYGRSLADFGWGLQQRGHHVEVLCSDAPYLGPSGPGPSGEPVRRCLVLKGNFANGVELLDNEQSCRQIDHLQGGAILEDAWPDVGDAVHHHIRQRRALKKGGIG